MANSDTPLLPPANSDSAPPTDQSLNVGTTVTDDELVNNGLTKVAIGVLVGATLGGIAGALANRGVVDRINQTVRDVGDAIKRAAANVNDNVQHVGDAVHSVSVGVNDTVKDVGNAVKDAAEGINHTVKDTLSTVRNSADNVQDTMKTTLSSVKGKTEGSNSEELTASSEDGTLYKLIPVNPGESDANSN